MKVLHIVGGLVPASGGPMRSVTGLCRALAQAGVDTFLLSHSPVHDMSNPSGVHVIKGGGVRAVDIWRTSARVFDELRPDIVHLNSLWRPLSHITSSLAYQRRLPVMLSTHGNLDPWALRQKALKKKIAMWCYQQRDLRQAACFHATAEQEAVHIRKQGLTQPIHVIPNGVDLPKILPERSPRQDDRKSALFLSRLHPGKGLIDLAQAWSAIRPRGWRMRIVGPDVCGHKAEVLAEVKRRGLEQDFEFVGALDDVRKWQEFVDADLFIHPSHSENFGISIAEALAAGVPVITTKGTPWSELQGSSDLPNSRTSGTSRCGWWIDIGPGPLADALLNAVSLTDEERRDMGRNGQQLVKTKYGWPMIAAQMITAYASIAAQRSGRREQLA
jgi:glycosyltransferase involved in cell wall biosynthesis